MRVFLLFLSAVEDGRERATKVWIDVSLDALLQRGERERGVSHTEEVEEKGRTHPLASAQKPRAVLK
jgi:hypothetical protein